MKNRISAITVALILLSILCSCGETKQKDNTIQAKNEIVKQDEVFVPFNIPFPEGTKYEIRGSEVYFNLPNSYYAVGIDENGNFHKSAFGGTGSITCECSQGSGCDPIIKANEAGCLMKDGCSECRRTSIKINNVPERLVDLIIIQPTTNLFITDLKQIEGNYFLPAKFLEYPEILNILTEIKKEQDSMAESKKELVFINLFGYILPIEVKMAGDNTSVIGNSINCICNVSGNCPKEKHWTGVVWCDTDNCSSCTMSGDVMDAKKNLKRSFSSENGKIVFKD